MQMLVRGLSVGEGWGGVNAFSMLGAKPAEFSGGPMTSQGALAAGTGTPLDRGGDKPWHPDSPLFWFGVLLAATFGLVGASTSIKAGPFKGSVGIGTT